MFRAQNELWRGQNRRKTSPKELLASDFEALEVSGAPRGDQESLKVVSKSSEVMIRQACRVIMSSPEALPDIDPAAARLRRICQSPSGGIFFRRRGPLSFFAS